MDAIDYQQALMRVERNHWRDRAVELSSKLVAATAENDELKTKLSTAEHDLARYKGWHRQAQDRETCNKLAIEQLTADLRHWRDQAELAQSEIARLTGECAMAVHDRNTIMQRYEVSHHDLAQMRG